MFTCMMEHGKKTAAPSGSSTAPWTIIQEKIPERADRGLHAGGGERPARASRCSRAASAAPRTRCPWRCTATGSCRWPCAGSSQPRARARAADGEKLAAELHGRLQPRRCRHRSATTPTGWPMPTRPSPTSRGKPGDRRRTAVPARAEVPPARRSDRRDGALQRASCKPTAELSSAPVSALGQDCATSASSPTSTPARPP